MRENVLITIASPRTGVYTPLMQIPGIQLVFVGAAACVRHKALEMDYLMANQKIAVLTLDEADFATGKYLTQITDAIKRVCAERNPAGIVLLPSCQCALLSTDYSMIAGEVKAACDVKVMTLGGCHLCNFEDAKGDGANPYEEVLFGFLKPAPKSPQPTVNILSTFPLAAGNDLVDVLTEAGIEQIGMLSCANTPEDYQKMAEAHLNIVCTDNGDALGSFLERELGIPFVVFPKEPDPEKISAAYEAITEKLSIKLNTTKYLYGIQTRIKELKSKIQNSSISVNGSLSCAKWLLRDGLPVTKVSYCPWEVSDSQNYKWLQENAPEVQVVSVFDEPEFSEQMLAEMSDCGGYQCGYQLCSDILRKLEDAVEEIRHG